MGTGLNVQAQVVARSLPQAAASAGVKVAPSVALPVALAAVKQHPAASLQSFSQAWKEANHGGAIAQWAGAAWAGVSNRAMGSPAQAAQSQFNQTLKSAGQNFAAYKTLSEVGSNLEARIAGDIDKSAEVFKGMTRAHAAFVGAMQQASGSASDKWAAAQQLATARETLRQSQKSLQEGAIFGGQDVKNLNIIMDQLKVVCSNTAQRLEAEVRSLSKPEVQNLFASRELILNQMGDVARAAGSAQKIGNKGLLDRTIQSHDLLKARHLELTNLITTLINAPPAPQPAPRPRDGVFASLTKLVGKLFRQSEQTRAAAAGEPLKVPPRAAEVRPALAAQVKGALVAAGMPSGVSQPPRSALEEQMSQAEARWSVPRPRSDARNAVLIDDHMASQLQQLSEMGAAPHQDSQQSAAAIKKELSKLNFKVPEAQLEGLETELAELDEDLFNEPLKGQGGIPSYGAAPSAAARQPEAPPNDKLSDEQVMAELNALEAEDLAQKKAVSTELKALLKESDEAEQALSKELDQELQAMQDRDAARAKLLDDLLRQEGLNPDDPDAHG